MGGSAPLFVLLQLVAALVISQPALAFSLCNTPFDINLDITLSLLRYQSTLFRFHRTSIGTRGIDCVFGTYQCQGDASLPECANCVSQIVDKMMSSCPRRTGAMERDDKCFLRYDNDTFFDPPDYSFAYIAYNTANDTSETFRSNRDSALNKVISAAPQNGGFSASYAGQSVMNRVYALAQCLGYLTSNDCSQCLSQVSTYQVYMGDHAGGVVVFHSCSYRYDKYLFYNTNTEISRTPANSPPRQSPANRHNTGTQTPANSTSQQSPANPHNTETRQNSKSATPIIVGATVASSVTLFLCISLAIWRRKKTKHVKRDDQNRAEGDWNLQLLPFQQSAKQFTMDELKKATRNFHPDNKLGEGGFGPVFKGTFKDGGVVAVKKLSVASRQGKRQFLNEVSLITSVQHRNLIQLLGCCVDGSERFLLVYEFLPKKSLDKHLFDSQDPDALDWHSRREIIIGTAKGLAYLHEGSQMRVVHRDIKASNILLDDNLNPKIADFGIARLLPGDDTHATTGVAGTLGYLAPEYAMHGQLTEKADTFSFGVVCLEVVTGRRSVERSLPPEEQILLELAWNLFKDGRPLELADPRLGGNFFAEEVVRVVQVALLCTQAQAGLRPAMSKVVLLLVGGPEILETPTKPAYMLRDTEVGMEGNRPMVPYVPPAVPPSSIVVPLNQR